MVLPEQAKNYMDECAAAAVAEGVAIAVDAEPGVVGSDKMDMDSGREVPQAGGTEDPADNRPSLSNCGGNGLRSAHLDRISRRMHTTCAPSR